MKYEVLKLIAHTAVFLIGVFSNILILIGADGSEDFLLVKIGMLLTDCSLFVLGILAAMA